MGGKAHAQPRGEMPRVKFDELPEDARVWVFPADRTLSASERKELLEAVDRFLDDWNAHGVPLRGGRDLRYDRFLVVGVDEASAPPSGCSIDALVRVFKEKEKEMAVGLLDRSPVWYREDGQIRTASRAEFGELSRRGAVGPATVVFDASVTRRAELEGGDWEKPASESWHARLL